MLSHTKNIVAAGAILVLLAACQTTDSGGYDPAVETRESGDLETSLLVNAERAESRGEYRRAVGILAPMVQESPDDVGLRIALSRNLRSLAQGVEAYNVMAVKAEENQKHPLYLLELGKASIAGRKPTSAINAMKQLTAMAPNDWVAYSILGIAHDLKGEYDEARIAYESALARSENNLTVLNNYALSRALAGDLDGGIAMLEEALSVDRGNPQVRQNLALLKGISGDVEEAEAVARMDLKDEEVDNNLSFYHRFPGRHGAQTSDERSGGAPTPLTN